MAKDYGSIQEFQKFSVDNKANGFFAIDDGSARYSAAETIGRRGSQEDAMFLVGSEQINNPQEYFRHHFAQMVADNAGEKSGTTAALYYFDPAKRQITTANLGDSRVYLTIKNGDEYRAILLTEDHSPKLPRVKKFITDNGGLIFQGNRVLSGDVTLAVGGAIGDNGFPLLTNPDIFTFDVDKLARTAFGDGVDINGLEFTVINACDGLTNHARDKNYDLVARAKFPDGEEEIGGCDQYEFSESDHVHPQSLSSILLAYQKKIHKVNP